MLGREGEQERIEQFLDAALEGPASLALEGAPGIGKSTLWRAAIARARGRGYKVIATAPAEPDTSLAFAGLGDLFDGLADEDLRALPDPQRRALAVALSMEEATQAPADSQALPRAVLSVLRLFAARAPLLIAVDDEQWLDRVTARVLAFALNRLREEPVCVLVARRPDGGGHLWPELGRAYDPRRTGVLVIEPLGVDTIRELIALRVSRKLPPPVFRRIYEASGGNPLYALAIAHELQATNDNADPGSPLPIPQTLSEAIARRLEYLGERCRNPLLVVAAAANPSVRLIGAALPEFALGDLDSALRAGVIEIADQRVRFTHPLLASTHYSSSPAECRRALHRKLALLTASEEERAHHLALGAEGPDSVIAMTLEQAATRAGRRGAPDIAAELLELSAGLTTAAEPHKRAERLIAAAEQHYVSGDLTRSKRLLESLLPELQSDPLRARGLLQLARLRTDDWSAARALYEEAITRAGNDDRLRARTQCELSDLCQELGQWSQAAEHAQAAVQSAERVGEPGLLAQALARQGSNAFFADSKIRRDLMERALGLEPNAVDASSSRTPSAVFGLILLLSDQPDAARPLLERSLRRADERGEEDDRWTLLFYMAHLEFAAGNVVVARQYAAQAGELIGQLADVEADALLGGLRAFIAMWEGDLESSRLSAARALELEKRIGKRWSAVFPESLLAMIELWEGRPAAAHDRLLPLREVRRGVYTPLWSCDVEALIALSRFDEAQVVADDLFSRATHEENPNAVAIAHRCRGLLLAACGEMTAAIDAMDEALAEHALRPLPLEIGRTLLEKGRLERRAKRKTYAKRTLEQALTTLERLEAAHWIEQVRDELGRIGLRRQQLTAGLTPAQSRVLELVTAGMSNREIAAKLYMSERSVESHLTKIYREYGVRSRTQLVRAMAPGANTTGELPAVGARPNSHASSGSQGT